MMPSTKEPLTEIQQSALLAALEPVRIGVLQGGHIDDDRPVYTSDDFLKVLSGNGVLMGLVQGRTPRELGIALLHVTERYERSLL